MTVLLTGATGFVGPYLLRRLAARHDVVAIGRREAPGARWVRCDLSAPLDPASLPERVDAIVHLAQSPRYREFPDGAADMFAVNVAAPAALLEYAVAAGARHFVLCSTGSVYGFNDAPVREDHRVTPGNYYAASRYAAEVLLAPYRSLLTTVVLRPFVIYGAGQRGMLVAGLAERVLAGEEITVNGDPGMRVNPIHAQDAARAIEAALALEDSDVINLAGDEAVTLTDLAQRLFAAASVEPRIAHRGDGPAGDLLGDNARMKARLVSPEVSLDAGLRGVIEALRATAGSA